MNVELVRNVLLAWPVVVVGLFGVIGPRRGVLVGLLAGLLFLPDGQVRVGPAGFSFPVDKFNVTGLGLALGALAFDPRALLRGRPRWPDLAMAAYYLAPLIGLVAGVPGSAPDVLDVMIGRGLGWVVPYAMGRIYFGRGDGPREVVAALAIAGLSYIPVCLYEEIAGPPRYLAGLIYGTHYVEFMVDRLGGWRPEGFLGNGLTLASWMAASAVMATWLWLGGLRLGRWPAWPAAVALLATSLSCRGVYGYVLLGLGLASALLTRGLRSRAVLVTLAVLPLVYMGLRGSGEWDGGLLVRAASPSGREGTVAYRLAAEDEIIHQVAGRNLAFGFGNYIWHGPLGRWPDGGWLHALWMGGLVGLTLKLAAVHVLPAALALSKPRGRPDGRQAASPTWALAAWCILLMIDGMHNTSYITPTALVAGTLVAAYTSGEAIEGRSRAAARGPAGSRPALPWPLIVTVVVLLAIEALGRWHEANPPPRNPPAPDGGTRTDPP